MPIEDSETRPHAKDRFRALLEQSPFSIQIISLEGRIVLVNRAWEELWGVTLDQIEGYNIFEDAQLIEKGVMPYIRRAFAGEAIDIPPVLYDPNATIPDITRHAEPQRWTKATIYPIKDDAGRVQEVVLMHEDITERKQAQEYLRISEERYQRAAESGQVGIWDLNLISGELYLAPNLKALLGYRDDELPNSLEAWLQLVHPEDKERTLAATKAHVDGSTQRYEVEVRRRHREGHYLWFLAQGMALRDASGKAYRLTGSDTDITLRKQVEEELRRSEERYRSLLENANDIIYSHDLQGNYLSINRAGEKITGYSREAVLGGMNIAQLVVPEHLERAKQMIERKLRDPTPTVYEVDIFALDGRRLTLEVSTRISYIEGQPVAVEGVARDVTERKRAEKERAVLAQQVEDQRKHLQAMVSSVPGVVWEAWGEPDVANQRIDFVSDYVETMLGYSVEEWLSIPNFWLTLVHAEDRESAARVASETFASGERGTNRFRWVAKDGRIVWVESQSVAICDESGRPIGMRGVTMDISERRQKEANERFLSEASTTLASSLDYETTLATLAHLAVPHFADWCSVDIANEDGTVSRLAVAHVDPEKVAWAHEMHERYPPDPAQPHGVAHVLRTGESEFYPDIPDELLVRSALDEKHLEIMRQIGFRSVMLVPLKARQRILGVLSFVNTQSSRQHTPADLSLAEDLASRAALAVDNARLYRMEQETRRAAERTSDRLLRLQQVSNALSQALTPQRVAAAVIEQGLTSLGAHAGTVVALGESGTELEIVNTIGFPPEIAQQWQRFPLGAQVPIADAARENVPVVIESFDLYRDLYPGLGPLASVTGSEALIAFPLNVEGRTIGAMGLSFPQPQSFTEDDRAFMLALAQQCAQALERARLYETEQRLRTQAEAANRIKDEFLATVSHELRTPLTAIVGWSSLLRTNKFDEAATARAIETIERNAKAQTQIIEDLLDVSRIITGKLHLNARSTELDSIIMTALEALRPAAATKGILLRSELDPGASMVWGDPARLQQVMWNLLSNALKFTPKGGEVSVALRRVESHVQITVSDTGQGISESFLPFVFERFRQADGGITRTHGGLGLGLAIVRHLVEMHGGTVRAESAGEGFGATFIVDLPLMAVQSVDQGSRQLSQSVIEAMPIDCPSTLNAVRVLIVDDEADTRLLLTTIIEQCGARVATAGSVSEALETLARFKPHILMSDIGMPEEDGYSLIRKVRALSREAGGNIPAVALTAYAREEDRMRALLAGFQVHVAKPINPAELIAVVGSLAGIRERK